jgi:hypothetical protein
MMMMMMMMMIIIMIIEILLNKSHVIYLTDDRLKKEMSEM